MKDLSFKTLLLTMLIPITIVALGMWRTYSTMDLVYAKQAKVYEIEKTLALQAKDYDLIKILLSQIDGKVDKNHIELLTLIKKETR